MTQDQQGQVPRMESLQDTASMCRVWRQRKRARPGLHGPARFGLAQESHGRGQRLPQRQPSLLCSSSPFTKTSCTSLRSANSADRPSCMLAAQAGRFDGAAQENVTNVHHQQQPVINPTPASIPSRVRDGLRSWRRCLGGQCSNRAPFLLSARLPTGAEQGNASQVGVGLRAAHD